MLGRVQCEEKKTNKKPHGDRSALKAALLPWSAEAPWVF